MTFHPADPDFYYRVDALQGLRALRSETHFRPKRWDKQTHPWQHRSLLSALQSKSDDQGIYRASFWINEQSALQDLRTRGSMAPHLLLRIRRTTVAQNLQGWHVEEDDFLEGQAALIWRCCPENDHGDHHFSGGIPLEEIDVSLDGQAWYPWMMAEPLLPNGVRMARIGWQPAAVRTRQGGRVVCHWQLVQAPGSWENPKPWCLVTLDEESRGTLGGETEAVAQLAEQLLPGPLSAVAEELAGVLTIHVTQDRLWTEQFSIDRWPRQGGSWLLRIARRLELVPPRWAYTATPMTSLARQQELLLVRASGLRHARTEIPAFVWQWGG